MIEKEFKIWKLSRGWLVESEGNKFAYTNLSDIATEITNAFKEDELRLRIEYFGKQK